MEKRSRNSLRSPDKLGKRLNKKGQDLSIGTLILIVLGIVVLVLLILGFTMGWDNLWDRINIFGGGASIGNVATACTTAVTTNDKFTYCEKFNKVKVDGKTEYVSCEDRRVAANLDSKLSCEGDVNTRIKAKCTSLGNAVKDDTNVNEVNCKQLLGSAPAQTDQEKCAEIKEGATLLESIGGDVTKCPEGTLGVSSGFSDGSVCCLPAA